MKKIRILYTIPNFDTCGSGDTLLNIAKRIDKDIFEPYICCNHDRGDYFETVKNSGLPVLLHNYLSRMIPRLEGLKNCWNNSRFFKRYGFDIIHSFHYSDDYSEALAAKLSGAKWVFTKKNMNWRGRAWKVRSRLADGIICLNTDMLKEFYPNSSKTKLVPLGIDTDRFKSSNIDTDLLKTFKKS